MKAARVLALVLVGIGAITGAVLFGQSAPGQSKQPSTSQGYEILQMSPGGPAYYVPGQDPSAQLVHEYVKAEKEEEKKEIRKKLAEALGKQFDAHMDQQQKELADLEKQIANLRTTLKKRQDAKSDIIERRMDQLIRDAEGLGWTVPGGTRRSTTVYGPRVPSNYPADKVPIETSTLPPQPEKAPAKR
jgi:hypothetical protein